MMISIIIPVYNIEKYISCCIDSVLMQTYTDFEIILIDDGSSDRSPEICDRYAEKDKRITVIHKQNEGLSAARNDGVTRAHGHYVAFLDGDDYWDDKNALEKLASRADQTHADIVNYSYKKVYEDTGKVEEYFHGIPDMPLVYERIEDQASFMQRNNLYIASACNKLIKRSILTEDLFFEKGVLSEDIYWCAKLLGKAECLDFVCENFYCYRQRSNSITHSVGSKTCKDLADNLINCFKYRETVSENKISLYDSFLAYAFGTFFINQALIKDDQVDEINRLASYSWVLSKGNNRKVKLLNIGCKVLGYKNICSIIRIIYRNKRVG